MRPATIPINYSANPAQKNHQVNSEYKTLRRNHAIAAMCDVLTGNVTGQGKADLTRACFS